MIFNAGTLSPIHILLIYQMVQVVPKRWSKSIKGNLSFREVKSELRGFIEHDLNSVDLRKFPNRPESRINLSLGDPTTSERFRTDSSNLQITAEVTKRQDLEASYHLQGIQEARKAVSANYSAKAFQITPEDVYITAGGCWSLFAVAKLLCNPGDNFLFPVPAFPFLLSIAQNNGFKVKCYGVKSEHNWQGDIAEMEALIDEKTRFVVVNDPSNPLGSCWSNEYKKKIIQLCRRHKLPLLADQIYQGISCDRSLQGFAELAENSEVPIFKCSGLSKQFCVPGWRVGWLIVYARKEVQKMVNKYLRKVLLTFPRTNMIAQASIPGIINNPLNKPSMGTKIGLIQQNLITLNQTLRQLPTHFQETKSAGAIYTSISVNTDSFNNEIKNVYDFCIQLYAEENIVILPGTLFGGKSQFVRLLTSTDHNTILNFCERLKNFCRKYRQ